MRTRRSIAQTIISSCCRICLCQKKEEVNKEQEERKENQRSFNGCKLTGNNHISGTSTEVEQLTIDDCHCLIHSAHTLSIDNSRTTGTQRYLFSIKQTISFMPSWFSSCPLPHITPPEYRRKIPTITSIYFHHLIQMSNNHMWYTMTTTILLPI